MQSHLQTQEEHAGAIWFIWSAVGHEATYHWRAEADSRQAVRARFGKEENDQPVEEDSDQVSDEDYASDTDGEEVVEDLEMRKANLV